MFSTFLIKHGLLTRRAGFRRLRITTVYRSHWLLPRRMGRVQFLPWSNSAHSRKNEPETLFLHADCHTSWPCFSWVSLYPESTSASSAEGLFSYYTSGLFSGERLKQVPPSHSFLVRILNNRARGHLQTGVIRLYLIHPPLTAPSSALTSCPVLAGPTSLPKRCPVLLSFHTCAVVLFPSFQFLPFSLHRERHALLDTFLYTLRCQICKWDERVVFVSGSLLSFFFFLKKIVIYRFTFRLFLFLYYCEQLRKKARICKCPWLRVLCV